MAYHFNILEGVSHVLGLSEGLSKLIAIDKQPNHQIVHFTTIHFFSAKW